MKAQAITIQCPKCASADVVYSCEPDCCFNHVCGDCLANYQLISNSLGDKVTDPIEMEESDSCAPTAACACCGSLRLGMLKQGDGGDTKVVCADCRALLSLSFSE